MNRPQPYTAKLEDKVVYNSKFEHYFFELVEPHRLDFQAGQYVSIQINQAGERRSYSICSAPNVSHGIEIVIDVTPAGIGTKFFQELQFGDEISFLAPLGEFVIADEQEANIALVATGSGIAPFRSIISDLLQDKQDQRSIKLYWGLRRAEEMIWQNEFELLEENFANFKFHPVLSQPPEEWPLCRGRVTDCLTIHDQAHNTGYYLCGRSQMIKAAAQLLLQRGVPETRIHFEKFF